MANLKDIDFYESQEYLTKDVMNRPIEQLNDNIVDVNTELEQLLNDDIVTTENGWSSHKIKQEIDSIDFEQASQLDDSIISTEKGWSSNKINQEIEDILDDGSVSLSTGWSSFKINSMLGGGTGGGSFDDNTVSPVTGWSSQKIDSEIDAILNDSVTSLDFGWSSQKIANYVAANTGGGGTGEGTPFPYWNIKSDFGAVGDGVTDDSTAFLNAYNTVGAGDVIVVPRGSYNVTSFPTGSKYVVWWAEGAFRADGVTPLGGEYKRDPLAGQFDGYEYSVTLPGLTKTSGSFKTSGVTEEVLIKSTTSPDDLTNTRFVRVADHTGGSGVATNIDVRTKVGENNTNFEWAVMSLVDNYSTDPSGGNVAVTGFINKYNNNPSWGGQFAAFDWSTEPDAGVNGIEVDVSANGADPLRKRMLGQFVGFKRDPNGAKCEIGKGLLIASYQFDTSKVKFGIGIDFRSEFDVGLDFFNSTFNTSVIRIGSGKNIDFSPNGDNTKVLRHSPEISEPAFVFRGSAIRPEQGISFDYTSVGTAIKIKADQKISLGGIYTGKELYFSGSRQQFVFTGSSVGFDAGINFMNSTSVTKAINLRIGQSIDFGGGNNKTLSYNSSWNELVVGGCGLRPAQGINFKSTSLGANAITFNDTQGITFGNSNDAELFYNGSMNVLVAKGRRFYMTHGFGLPSGNGNVSANATSGGITPPSKVQGYIVVPIDGINRKIPFYNN